uniref:C-type lectin domain-containing protein n=1 Tax=Sander lucioperca TaxID=283035 RepID=A0A8C9XA59_SANLU
DLFFILFPLLDHMIDLYEYHFIGENMKWKEAQEYCRKSYTDLATVSKQTDMKRLLDSTTEQYRAGAWIGLQRDWCWSQPGVEFNESKWSPGQPDNYGNQENCVWMKNDTWDDDSCSRPYNFICYDGENMWRIDPTVMTWLDAQSYCREHHTDLISGVKQLEDFKTQGQNDANRIFWIGLFRDCWSWSDGSSFSFRSWDKDEPEKTLILIKKNMIWEEGLYYCRDHYRHLVSITNQGEQLWVQERAKTASTPYVWLGLRYTCTLDFWFWVTDETVRYTNWGPGQSGDDCNMSGAMDREGTHQSVKMIDDDHKFNFICSK